MAILYTGNVEAPVYLGNVTLPLYADITETTEPNLSKNISLGGSLLIDYVNNRRSWEIHWNYIKSTQYDLIRGLYDNQFLTSSMPTFFIPSVSLAVPVFINIKDKNIKWNGKMVENFTILLEEAFAIS